MNADKSQTLEHLRRAVALQRLQQRDGTRHEKALIPPIARADRSAPLPLSWAQLRLWFLDQLDHAAGAAYHMPVALRLSGRLDQLALQATLNRVVARHENLRTTFGSGVDGSPTQLIAPADCGFNLITIDLSDLDAGTQDATVAAQTISEAQAAFDLASGPLIRGRLLRLADAEHLLLLTQHHIISDGWSIGVLVKEVSALYTAFSQQLPDPLPDLAIQYADYALWQRQWMQDQVLQEQIAFWRTQLAGAPTLLELPADRSRPVTPSYAGNRVDIRLSAQLTAALRALSRRHGTTVFMTLLAGWSLLLSRLSGQDDVVIGTAVANRQRSEFESLIGFFVNTLALRVSVTAKQTVSELLAQVKATTLDAYAHQDLPFEQVVEALQPARTLSYSPIFQTVLAFNNTPGGGELALPGLSVARVGAPRHSAHFDLELSLWEAGEALHGNLGYATDLFDRSTVERFVEYFVAVLDTMVTDDTQPVSRLLLLSASQRQQLLVEFNATQTPYPQDRLIHAWFEEQAQCNPNAAALVFDGQALSYSELNRRANQTAHRLLALGVKPDDRVAICVERSLELVIGVLGVLKAGGGYVPLDPLYPDDRLGYMLADSAPVALLTQSALQGKAWMQASAQVPVLVLDDGSLSAQPTHDPVLAGLTSRHLAYVIYTSGSTGQPKGVMVEHRSLSNLATAQIDLFSVRPESQVLQFASFSFDASIFEIVMTLCVGACLHLARREALLPGEPLLNTLRQGQITHVTLPPSALMAFADADIRDAEVTLIVAGEALPPQLARKWARRNRLFNAYGPTETTVCATSHLCGSDQTHRVPIGRPIANTLIYILDRCQQPVPLGVAGEICIGGVGVARGYLNRPELTLERFLSDPFTAEPNARMYRTGDLGRWLPDGEIEYLGRNDFQVKIRGFRIELGEIETKLTACEGVREAVVIAREDVAGDKRLVAYVVPHEGVVLSLLQLRESLSRALAEHMIPSAFVSLESLPLTLNGKLDRKALPAPDHLAVLSRKYEAPVGKIEQSISTIWQELLGLQQVGRHDHFFELGGHSLLVVSLIERLRRHGLHADVRMVFAAPTLSALAERLSADPVADAVDVAANLITLETTAITPELLPLVNLTAEAIDTIVASVPGGVSNVQDIYPLAPLQEGILFHHLLEAESEGDTYLMRSVVAFDSRERMDGFLVALQSVIDRHDILRTSLHWQGLSQPVQVVHRRARLPVHVLTLSPEEAALPQLLAHTDPRRMRLDLQRAPILAAYAANDTRSNEWLLALSRHHVVCDHITMDLILAEIQILLQGQHDRLPTPMPYRDFIARTHAIPEAEHEAYFRHQLGDVDQPTAPFGVLNVQGDGKQVEESRLIFGDLLAQRIRESARHCGVAPAVLFHVAWAQVLAQCSGRNDVVFGTVLSGRLQGSEGAERVVGMFINTLPIRIPLAQLSVAEAVRDTYRRLSDLLSHEQASLSLAQRCSAISPPLPLFTSLLNYRHSRDATPDQQSESAQVWAGVRQIGGEERTNYPVTMSVDDLGLGFGIAALTVSEIDGLRLLRYLEATMQALVDALADNPQQPLLRLNVLPAAERQQVLSGFNMPQSVYPADQSIHALFEEQVRRHPDAIALVFEDQVLSYAELNQRANQVAHRLLALGVKPDDRVAICVARSVELVIGVLGILKSGGGYVPLDPVYPADRLAYMLADSSPIAILTQSALRYELAMLEGAELPVILLDDVSLSSQATHNPDPAISGLTSNHLAYVIYTSGSTGQPKGVMVEHGHVTRLFAATQDWFAFDRSDVWTLFHSFAFDFSVWEIWGALLYGGRLVVVPELCARAPSDFYALLTREGVTVLNQTPSAFRSLIVAQSQSATPHSLRTVIFGGEALELHMLAPWIERNDAERTQLINMYGITEITVHATYRRITAADMTAPRGSLIGRALPDLQLYVLGDDREPLPIGVTGELYVGGSGVARGYLNRAQLTTERFIADPYSGLAGARLYRTGDLARWLSDGTLEYLGRNDFQVKIRGFRIELGEIEAKLSACAGVREAVVIAREDSPGDKRLVAYVVGQDGVELAAAELRASLSRSLAEYMIPSAFVNLAVLPLTPNGKLDRKALPAPDQAAVASRMYVAPVGEVETAIAAIWQELLGLEQVGRHDHFFELGGHSLLVIGLIERLRQRGLSLDVRAVFTSPTLSDLATHMLTDQGAASADIPANLITAQTAVLTPELLPLVNLKQAEIDAIAASVPGGVANIQDIYPLAPLQEGILFHHLLEGESGGDTYLLRSVVAFDSRGRLDGFLVALQAVIDRHDILRSAMHWQGLSQPVQVVHRRAPLPIHELTLSPDEATLPQLLARTDPRRVRLDLQRAPLLAAYISYDAQTGEWLLALLNHHIVEDNYSKQLMLREAGMLLQGLGDQLPAPMPYRNFIARTHAVPETQHEIYFREQLGDVDEPTAPFGVLNVQMDGGQANETRVRLDDALARRIRDCARRHAVTPSVLFHVAWAQVLAQCSGREDVVFGTVLSGRLQGSEGADQVVGMFINTLPIRIPLAQVSVVEAVRDTYRRLSDLLAHEQASLTVAQRCSAIAPPLPLFTALLNYRNRREVSKADDAAAAESIWEGVRPLSGDTRNNYPLTMSVEDRGQEFGLTLMSVPGIDGARVSSYLETAMEALAKALETDATRPLRSLSVLPASERDQVLYGFNATAT
ncbi:MAG: amino acid adenylation domain-containing protein, partial [Pseudomonadota bacterium]|nr:amino acid adenylation domain-containing protein [Pseudomonadota bacterium]